LYDDDDDDNNNNDNDNNNIGVSGDGGSTVALRRAKKTYKNPVT
jgi:hypothetical protein